jgi:hypothetical protein
MDSTPAPEAAPGASSVRIWRGEECIQEDELRRLLDNKPVLICYDGFEPPDACTSLRFELLSSAPASRASRA